MFGETTNSHVKFSVTIHNDTIEPVEDVSDKIDNEISVRVDQKGELDMIKIGPFDSTARVATPSDLSDKKDQNSIKISTNKIRHEKSEKTSASSFLGVKHFRKSALFTTVSNL